MLWAGTCSLTLPPKSAAQSYTPAASSSATTTSDKTTPVEWVAITAPTSFHPYFCLGVGIPSGNQQVAPVNVSPGQRGTLGYSGHQWISPNQTFDIFEGTEQIQQLVISRAISGIRIE